MSRRMIPMLMVAALSFTAWAAEDAMPGPKIPQRLELSDQYDTKHVVSFPTTNVIFLTIADRKGSEQIAGWITALKARPEMPVDIRGLADVGGVPGFLRGRIRKRFQETILYPVMMDWSGKVCAQFKYVPDLANVYIIDRNGALVGHFSGRTNAAGLKEAFVALDKALATPVNAPTNAALKQATLSKP
ncbi:MAG: hypothetical protein IPK15_11255 [Verrucomicrobia bacterium]|nr:hypothetical protein [Verrucomicrobiota bacterium]